MQPFHKLTFNSAPSLPAQTIPLVQTFQDRRAHPPAHRARAVLPYLVLPDLWMRNAGIRVNFFVSSWVVEVQPGRAILEKPSAAPDTAEPTYLLSFDGGRPPQPRWGVVQPVGHHTVNVDGEGSNPSAPANFLFPLRDLCAFNPW